MKLWDPLVRRHRQTNCVRSQPSSIWAPSLRFWLNQSKLAAHQWPAPLKRQYQGESEEDLSRFLFSTVWFSTVGLWVLCLGPGVLAQEPAPPPITDPAPATGASDTEDTDTRESESDSADEQKPTGLPREVNELPPATPTLVQALNKKVPQSLEDLRAIQERVLQVVEQSLPATVAILSRGTRGSGVIVSAGGYVLTAGHVSGTPGQRVRVVLADGRRVQGETLGWGQDQDLGLIRITDEGTWPTVPMALTDEVEQGDWCVAIGHPGGLQRGRPPVVRTGRVFQIRGRGIRTDCVLASGDSGGPLFDMDGNVIGIHSRISADLTGNYHVPVARFHESWTRLTQSDVWGGRTRPVLGVFGETTERGCVVTGLVPNYPAQKAGIRESDLIRKVNEQTVANFEALVNILSRKKIGDEVTLEIERESEVLKLKVALAQGGG